MGEWCPCTVVCQQTPGHGARGHVGTEDSERETEAAAASHWSPANPLAARLAAQSPCYNSHGRLFQLTFFLTKWKKENNGKCSVKKKRVPIYLLQIFQPRNNSYRLWTSLSSSCPMRTETHWRSAGPFTFHIPPQSRDQSPFSLLVAKQCAVVMGIVVVMHKETTCF